MATFGRDGESQPLALVRDGAVVTESGVAGERRTTHTTEIDALAAFDRRVNELVDNGWAVLDGDGDLGLAVACDEPQERAILDASEPERTDRMLVYTDWLIERADPCGELASLRRRNEADNDPALAALIQRMELQHERALFGLLHRVRAPRGVVQLVYRNGWVDLLDVATSSGTLVAMGLLAPMSRFVRGLVFRRQVARRICHAVASSPRRDHVRYLHLASGDAQPILDALPALSTVKLPAKMFVERGHPRVDRLEVETFGDYGVGGRWPSVTTIALTLTPHMVVPDHRFLRPFPALRTIALSGHPGDCDAFALQVPPSVHLVRT